MSIRYRLTRLDPLSPAKRGMMRMMLGCTPRVLELHLLELHCLLLKERPLAIKPLTSCHKHNLTPPISLSILVVCLNQWRQHSDWANFLWLGTGSLHNNNNTRMQCSRLHGFLTTPLWSLHASGTIIFCRPRVLFRILWSSKSATFATGVDPISCFRRGMYVQPVSDFGRLQHDRIPPTRSSQCLSYADTWTFRKCWCKKIKSRSLRLCP